MNDYTQAPACRLLATHCVVCGRALLDAVSVELGIGPEKDEARVETSEGEVIHQVREPQPETERRPGERRSESGNERRRSDTSGSE